MPMICVNIGRKSDVIITDKGKAWEMFIKKKFRVAWDLRVKKEGKIPFTHTWHRHGWQARERFQFMRAHGKLEEKGHFQTNYASFFSSDEVMMAARIQLLVENKQKMKEKAALIEKELKEGGDPELTHPFTSVFQNPVGDGMSLKDGVVTNHLDIRAVKFRYEYDVDSKCWVEVTGFPDVVVHKNNPSYFGTQGEKPPLGM